MKDRILETFSHADNRITRADRNDGLREIVEKLVKIAENYPEHSISKKLLTAKNFHELQLQIESIFVEKINQRLEQHYKSVENRQRYSNTESTTKTTPLNSDYGLFNPITIILSIIVTALLKITFFQGLFALIGIGCGVYCVLQVAYYFVVVIYLTVKDIIIHLIPSILAFIISIIRNLWSLITKFFNKFKLLIIMFLMIFIPLALIKGFLNAITIALHVFAPLVVLFFMIFIPLFMLALLVWMPRVYMRVYMRNIPEL